LEEAFQVLADVHTALVQPDRGLVERQRQVTEFLGQPVGLTFGQGLGAPSLQQLDALVPVEPPDGHGGMVFRDRKSTRLNSSHVSISYAVFCLKKKTSHISIQI